MYNKAQELFEKMNPALFPLPYIKATQLLEEFEDTTYIDMFSGILEGFATKIIELDDETLVAYLTNSYDNVGDVIFQLNELLGKQFNFMKVMDRSTSENKLSTKYEPRIDNLKFIKVIEERSEGGNPSRYKIIIKLNN